MQTLERQAPPGGRIEAKLTTSYMGPIEADTRAELICDDPNPLGRFLTGLLRRLGPADPELGVIGTYLEQVGLFGIGQGRVRTWELDRLPEDLRNPAY